MTLTYPSIVTYTFHSYAVYFQRACLSLICAHCDFPNGMNFATSLYVPYIHTVGLVSNPIHHSHSSAMLGWTQSKSN